MASVLLATCAALPDGDEDAPSLVAALERIGVSPRWVAWDDPATRWDDALVVLRSTWDYTSDRARFLDWAARVLHLANDAAVVAWNTDKVYLRDLDAAGVPIVETVFAEPGQEVRLPDSDEVVVKPSIGAGSRGVGRFAISESAEEADRALRHAAELHRVGRTVLVQPYLGDVDAAGETALMYFDGRFSHAVRKAPMLAPRSTHPVSGPALYIEEKISAREPSDAELAVGALTLDAVRGRFGADQLYTRVDLLPSPRGPVVVELELVEPSLFLGYGATGADTPADRLAAAIADRA